MKISGIYKIQSLKFPQRFYIGSSYNIQRRWMDHIRYFARGKHHSKKLQAHYDKYGKNDLVFSVVIGCDKDDLLTMEQFFLDSMKPYFNVNPKAHSSKGRPPWNKGIKTGIVPPNVFKKGNTPGLKGKTFKMSDEHKKNIGEASRLAWIRRKEQKLMQDISVN